MHLRSLAEKRLLWFDKVVWFCNRIYISCCTKVIAVGHSGSQAHWWHLKTTTSSMWIYSLNRHESSQVLWVQKSKVWLAKLLYFFTKRLKAFHSDSGGVGKLWSKRRCNIRHRLSDQSNLSHLKTNIHRDKQSNFCTASAGEGTWYIDSMMHVCCFGSGTMVWNPQQAQVSSSTKMMTWMTLPMIAKVFMRRQGKHHGNEETFK